MEIFIISWRAICIVFIVIYATYIVIAMSFLLNPFVMNLYKMLISRVVLYWKLWKWRLFV